MTQINAGRVRFVSRGEYNNTTQYYLFDLVNYNGNSYYAKENTLGNLPTDTSKWQLIAEKGNIGPTGQTGATGNGISNIQKTSTSGLVDTYTITYTDGTTTTYQVTNGEDGEVTQEQLDEVIEENTYLNNVINQLPRVNDTGDTITLNNTIEAKMKSKLSPSEMEQKTTTGKNLFDKVNATLNNSYYTLNSDGDITTSITFAYEGRRYLNNILLEAGTYTLSFIPNLAVGDQIRLSIKDNDSSTDIYNDSITITNGVRKSQTFTLTEAINIGICIEGHANTYKPLTLTNIQLESGSSATSYEPYTNGASPNPQYLQEIHTITGDNVIRDEGKNLLNIPDGTYTHNGITAIVSNGKITLNGTASSNSFIGLTTSLSLKAGTYTLSLHNSTTNSDTGTYVRFDNDANMILRYTTQNAYRNITLSEDTTYGQLVIRTSSGITLNNFVIYPQLEKGSTATSFEPYTLDTYSLTLGTLEYSKIGDYEDEFILTSGKNAIIDLYGTSANYISYNVDKSKLSNTMTYSFVPNFTIATMNVNLRTTGTTNYSVGQVSLTSGAKTTITFNLTDEQINTLKTENVVIQLYKSNAGLTNPSLTNPMLAEGTDTNYEPYGSGEWYLKKNIGKVVLDGTETWEKYADGVFRTLIANAKEYNWNVLGAIKSDKYIAITQQQAQGTDYDYGISLRTSNTGIVIRNKDYTTTDNFKTYLSTNNTIVCYALTKPEYLPLNDTLQEQLTNIYNNMMSKKGQTNISQVANDLPMVITASALLDLNTLVQ